MPKRRVVHLIETLNCGGTENNLLRLLPELEKAGWHNTIITLRSGGEMLPRFKAANIEVIELNGRGFLSPQTIRSLLRTIRQRPPDLIITNLFRADVLGRLVLPLFLPIPIISYLHTTYNHPRYWSARLFEWLTQPLARHYIANAIAVRDFYQQKLNVPAHKMTVVEGGIDLAMFQKASDTAVRQELKLPAGAIVVTCVGNLASNKGQADLLAAFEAVSTANPKTFLLLVGEGENRQLLENLRQQSSVKANFWTL